MVFWASHDTLRSVHVVTGDREYASDSGTMLVPYERNSYEMIDYNHRMRALWT